MPITITSSDYNTVTVASQELTAPMVPGYEYRLTSDTDCYFKIGATGATTAAAADGSHFLGAGREVIISASSATAKYVAIIRKDADGVCTLSKVEPGAMA